MISCNIPFERVCLLDPKASLECHDWHSHRPTATRVKNDLHGSSSVCVPFDSLHARAPVSSICFVRYVLTVTDSICEQKETLERHPVFTINDRGFPTRHLSPVQMTTDTGTALGVTKRVVVDRGSLRSPFFSPTTSSLSFL